VVVFLSASLLVGCWSGSSPEAPADSGSASDADADSDGDADADGGPEPVCPDPASEECDEEDPLPLLAKATQIGNGLRFVDVSRGFALFRKGDGPDASVPVYAIDFADLSQWSVTYVYSSGVQLDPVAITSCMWENQCAGYCCYCNRETFKEAFGFNAIFLVCSEEGCRLHGTNATPVDPDATYLVEWGEVPAAGELRGLYSVDGYLCAYVDGIHCFDGAQWETFAASGAGMINDMDCAGSISQCRAVGDDGLYLRSGGSDPVEWETPWNYVSTGEDLISVAWNGDAVSSSGLLTGWWWSEGIMCPLADAGPVAIALEPAAADLPDVPGPSPRVLLEDGRVVRYGFDPEWGAGACFSGTAYVHMIGVLHLGCQYPDGLMVLTEENLYGESGCD
jgi:hypothetical protein